MAKLYTPGGPAGGSPVEIRMDSEGLHGGDLRLPWDGMDARLGGYEDAWVLLSAPGAPGVEIWLQPEELAALLASAEAIPGAVRARLEGVRGTRQHRAGTRLQLRLAFAAVLVALLAWFFSGGLVDLAVRAIPPSAETVIGDLAAEAMTGDTPPCADVAVSAAVESVFGRLREQLEPTPYEFRVRVLGDPQVNAFALPGGEVFVLSGLLDRAGDEHELAAVLGHELYHVVLRHGMRGIVRAAGLRVALALLLGDASETLQLLGQTAGNLTALSFGRDQEREADERGMRLIARAGFDPGGAVRFFGKLAEDQGDTGGSLERMAAFASTHPASSERQERLRGIAASVRPKEPRGIEVDWGSLKERCAAPAAAPPAPESP
jgi:predicted Zn-dependent protease